MPNFFDNDFKKKLQQTMMESSSGNSLEPGLYFGVVNKLNFGIAKSSGKYQLVCQLRATQRGRSPIDGVATIYLSTAPNQFNDEFKQLKKILIFLDGLKTGIPIEIENINSFDNISNLTEMIFDVVKDWEISFEVQSTKNPNFPKITIKEVYPTTPNGDVKF